MAPAPASVKQTSSGGSDRSNFRRIEDEEVKPYVIVGDLGKGSFATVYRGYHEVRIRPPSQWTHLTDSYEANTPSGGHQDCQ